MVDYREIIRLKSTKPEMSNTMIASSVGSSRNTVSEVWKLVQEKGLSWPVPAALTNRDLEQILYPEPVSYTHLDVYKRQGKYNRIMWSST